MNQYVTDAVIKKLREKNHFTQAKFADKFNVSDKSSSIVIGMDCLWRR